MALIGPDNAIGWAQFIVRGGMRNLLGTMGVTALAIIGGVILTAEFADRGTNAMHGWAVALLAAQGVVLVLFGGSRVNAAIRADLGSGIIESHRLMPTPPLHAALGYVFGATAQALGLAGVIFVVGGIVAMMGDIEPARWIAANVILLVFAIGCWAFSAVLGFASKGGLGGIILLGVFILSSEGILLIVLPGSMVLLSPLIGRSILSMRVELSWVYLFAMTAQLLLAAVCCLAAARRYAREGATATSLPLALSALCIWVILSIVATEAWEDFKPTFEHFPARQVVSQFYWTLLVSMLVALLPVSNVVRQRADWESRARWDTTGGVARPAPAIAIVAVSACLTLAGACVLRDMAEFHLRLALSAVAVTIFLLQMRLLLGWVYQVSHRGAFIGSLWMVLTWAAPILVDIALQYQATPSTGYHPGVVSAVSPAGALHQIWQENSWARNMFHIHTGLLMQALVTLIPAGLYWLSRRKQSRGDSFAAMLKEDGNA